MADRHTGVGKRRSRTRLTKHDQELGRYSKDWGTKGYGRMDSICFGSEVDEWIKTFRHQMRT
jgi:hypothetical protein